jgi:peptidylprolyl isomerase
VGFVKVVIVLAAAAAAVALAGCSGNSKASRPEPRTVAVVGPRGRLNVEIPKGRPPKNLVVKDLRKGSGPAIDSLQDEILVNYVDIEFSNGKQIYNSWEHGGPSKSTLYQNHPGWEIGLMGMRVGGLRELITPPRLEYSTATLIYVIELVKVRHRSS